MHMYYVVILAVVQTWLFTYINAMSLSSMPLTIKRSLAAELGDKVAQLGLVNGIVTPESVDDVWEWYVKEGLATTDPDPSWGKIWDTSVHLSQHQESVTLITLVPSEYAFPKPISPWKP